MATKNYTIVKMTEKEIDEAMTNSGMSGYSECYYSNKREVTTTDDEKTWAVDVKVYYG